MYTNGANNYPSQFPTYNYGGGYNMAANYGGGFMQAAGQYQRPNANDLWCLPIQNFRIDGGNTNLYNQKVTIDWPQFRPQTPIFSGPTVGQDTTNIYANPGSNFNFDDCGYSNVRGGVSFGWVPYPSWPNPWDCFQPSPNPKSNWPTPTPGPKPNPNDCWPYPFPPQIPNPKPDPNDCWDPQHPGTSGKGSIDGTNFRSGDGERYELRLEAGRSYNLLSDTAVGLNGTYGTVDGETVLTDVALNIRGKIVTLADDGTLRIDGKAFDRRNNNLGGDVIENRDGSYTIKTDNYEFELKASEYGIKVNIDAQRAINPEQRQGLWGVTLDGEQNTEAELQRAIQEYDYKIDDALTFDYEDNNNISGQYVPDFDEEERNDLVWNSRNPQLSSAQLALNGRGGFFAARGPNGAADDATWRMNGLQDNRVYNVFSDEGIQVNGKFKDGKATELGFVVDGDEVKFTTVTGNNTLITVNGRVVTNYRSDYINVTNGVLTVSGGDSDGENYSFRVTAENDFLNMVANVDNIGDNGTRSSGLLGDALSSNIRDGGSTGDDDGAGLLRDENGALSNSGDDMTRALREYLMDDLFDTSSGRSVYE
jgi:hypothetical protein